MQFSKEMSFLTSFSIALYALQWNDIAAELCHDIAAQQCHISVLANVCFHVNSSKITS